MEEIAVKSKIGKPNGTIAKVRLVYPFRLVNIMTDHFCRKRSEVL